MVDQNVHVDLLFCLFLLVQGQTFLIIYPKWSCSQSTKISSSFFLSFFQHFDGPYLLSLKADLHQTWSKVVMGQSHHYVWPTGVKSHLRSNEVKKTIFTRKVSTPLRYKILSCNLVARLVLTFSTKVITLKNCLGSNGVMRPQKRVKFSSLSDFKN